MEMSPEMAKLESLIGPSQLTTHAFYPHPKIHTFYEIPPKNVYYHPYYNHIHNNRSIPNNPIHIPYYNRTHHPATIEPNDPPKPITTINEEYPIYDDDSRASINNCNHVDEMSENKTSNKPAGHPDIKDIMAQFKRKNKSNIVEAKMDAFVETIDEIVTEEGKQSPEGRDMIDKVETVKILKQSDEIEKLINKDNLKIQDFNNTIQSESDVNDTTTFEIRLDSSRREETSEIHKISYQKCTEYTGSRGGVGGEDSDLGEFPHMAIIGWLTPASNGYTFKCGGSLISENYILTAAHCLKASSRDSSILAVEPSIVRLGEQNILRDDEGANPIDVPIKRTIPHPKYQSPKKYNDIGLIQLWNNVQFSEHIRPACLSTNDHYYDGRLIKEAIVTGWGITDSDSKELSPVLQKVRVDILDSRLCDELVKSHRSRLWQGFRDSQLCAGALEGGRDACQGDSGGPLQRTTGESKGARYTIVGVTSFGFNCGKKNKPGVYTRVFSYTAWIESIVWPDAVDIFAI